LATAVLSSSNASYRVFPSVERIADRLTMTVAAMRTVVIDRRPESPRPRAK
jgi:hypothetical protein